MDPFGLVRPTRPTAPQPTPTSETSSDGQRKPVREGFVRDFTGASERVKRFQALKEPERKNYKQSRKQLKRHFDQEERKLRQRLRRGDRKAFIPYGISPWEQNSDPKKAEKKVLKEFEKQERVELNKLKRDYGRRIKQISKNLSRPETSYTQAA